MVLDHRRSKGSVGRSERRGEHRHDPQVGAREQHRAHRESLRHGEREAHPEEAQGVAGRLPQPSGADLGGIDEQQDGERELQQPVHDLARGVEGEQRVGSRGEQRADPDEQNRHRHAVTREVARRRSPHRQDRGQRDDGDHGKAADRSSTVVMAPPQGRWRRCGERRSADRARDPDPKPRPMGMTGPGHPGAGARSRGVRPRRRSGGFGQDRRLERRVLVGSSHRGGDHPRRLG